MQQSDDSAMEFMVNATVRRHMKERRPVYVRWKGNWYSGEVVRCGPAYVYKVKSVVNREIYLLERSKIKILEEDNDNDGDILAPGTDVAYFNQLTAQWEHGVIITHDDCGYAQIRWKMPGMYEEFVNWFEASNVSTTPPNMPHTRKLLKPGLFGTQESISNNEEENEDVENNLLLQTGYRKRTQNSAKSKLFARIRSKQAPPRSSDDDITQEEISDRQSPVIEEFTVENIDPHSNPAPPKFSGIPPKWLAPTPVYYPCPMYVPVPVLIPHYPPRPPSISYPFFPGQIFEHHFGRYRNSKGIPPHKGAFKLFRIVPKHQSRLMSKQPFAFSGHKLSKYEPKSLEVERKIEYLPPYESIIHSKFKSARKAKDKRCTRMSSTSGSSEEDELSLYSRRPASADSARSRDQAKSFRPGSGNSGKNRTRASTELTKSFVMEKKLSDLPSSSPTIKEPDFPIVAVTEPMSKHSPATPHETQNSDIIRDEDDVIADGQIPVMSSDSGVRTDTAAYSTSNQQHADCSEDDQSSPTMTVNNNNTVNIPAIVIENSSKRLQDTSDSEVFSSESKVNPSHASIEQYLLGSEQFSDAEHTTSLPRELKSSSGSATELYLNTVASSSSLSHSAEVSGDITTTCRSKRRLMYSANSEPETKPGSTDSGSNDESDASHRSPEKQKFTTALPTAVELPEESLPGTPKAQNSHDNENSPPQSPVTYSNKKMSSFLKSLSPVRLMSLRPKKKVTFTT